MTDNIREIRQATRHDWIKELDRMGADPLIIVAVNADEELVILNKLENPMEAIGFLEAAKINLAIGEDV